MAPSRRKRPRALHTVYALGHSTRPLDELLALLASVDVSTLADIRTIPRSRHNPQYNQEALAKSLPRADVRYVHLPQLGGRRRGLPRGSPNGAWRNASFRGYADYMQSEQFEQGLDQLLALAQESPVAMMCAEAVPWRCHRSLVADALFARGVIVEHLRAPGRSAPHRLTPFAHVEGPHVTYPAQEQAAP